MVEYLRPPDAARQLNIKPDRLRKAISRKRIPTYQISGSNYVRIADVQWYLKMYARPREQRRIA